MSISGLPRPAKTPLNTPLYVLERWHVHETPKSKTPNALEGIRGLAFQVFCGHEAVPTRKMSGFRGVFARSPKP